MTTAAINPQAAQDDSNAHPQSTRETVESIVVAFILAFLFRAFVAEAFVIPTGSMAPTLMGAHKDLFCEHCGQQYQASASLEFDSNSGAVTRNKTIASTCSTCRGINAYDFRGDKNHASFSGDRILVSKFDYILSKPKRWDVFVFKYPLGARMNYIKRLIGLPGETLLLSEGDVYVKGDSSQPWGIARKPPHKIKAMKQIVSDTDHLAPVLRRQGWPSLWQPWNLSGSPTAWTVSNTDEGWSAQLDAKADADWIRYFHKFVDVDTWSKIQYAGAQLAPVDPLSSQLITDYLAYNSSYTISASDAFDLRSGLSFLPIGRGPYWAPVPDIPDDVRVLEYVQQRGARIEEGNGENNDGYHWVGDLTGEFSVEIQSNSGTLLLDVVEFGVHFQCAIDVATGQATLQALEGNTPLAIFDGTAELKGNTEIRGPGNYSVELANFDDQIVLWVNGQVVEFEKPTSFDSHSFRTGTARRPHWTSQDPLDAAPLGIGGVNLAMQVTRARVFRDIYYIAIQGNPFSDFDLSRGNLRQLSQAVPDLTIRAGLRSGAEVIAAVYAHPEWWSKTNLFQQRGELQFELEDKQYFPMGDNSAASSDARAWYGHNFVEERYLLGKALLVFWPHTWNTPVPFTPNVSRMGLIR